MKIRTIAPLACLLALAACGKHEARQTASVAEPADVKLTLVPQGPLAKGKPVQVLAKLNWVSDGSVITLDNLNVVHTEKFHLLVVDPGLTDYQHIHPAATDTPGVWRFSFTPKMAGGYRAWADVTPAESGEQEFAMADLGKPQGKPAIRKEYGARVGNYRFGLSFDQAPVFGESFMGAIEVTDAKGRPVKKLEPVMGAFAHIVGFYDDYRTVLHTHPMTAAHDELSAEHGEDIVSNAHAHGGPKVMFHLTPAKPGLLKLFAQFKIDGKDYVVPFGVKIESEPAATAE